MKRECLAAAVVFCIFGLIFTPSINADLTQKSLDDDFVKLDIELCGIGLKHIVKLTQEEYLEVELLFNDIQERLSDVETDDEAIIIFNDAIVKLDIYGFLGGLSVKQAQELITSKYHKLKQNKFFQDIINNIKSDDNENYFCLISGETTKTRVIRLFEIGCSGILIPILGFSILSEIVFGSAYFLYKIVTAIRSLNNFYQDIFNPLNLGMIGVGCRAELFPGGPMSNFSSEGWVWTQGLNGVKSWNGTLLGKIRNYANLITTHRTDYIGVMGFVGFKTTTYKITRFFGFANRVKIDYVNWI